MTCTVFVQVLIDGTLPLLFLYTFCMPGKHFDCQEYLYTVHCSQCLVLCGPFTLISYFSFPLLTVGRTRKVIPPPWYKGKGGWWTPPPLEFLKCCSTSKRFCLQWKAFDLLYKMRYLLLVVSLLGACDVTKKVGRHLGFFHELEIG